MNDKISIRKGEICLHDKSGTQITGSYYTPDFAVEHLLDGALETTLDEHLKNMTQLSDPERLRIFNFRVADIAMIRTFFVAAIDP